MKHFKSAHHATAASNIVMIATSLGLAANAVGFAVNAIMLDPNDDQTFKLQINAAIDNVDLARQSIELVFNEFRQDGGPTEAKDVDHIVTKLVDAGYLKADSQAVNTVMMKGLDAAFSKLDTLINNTTDKLALARDSFTTDGTDSYLGYTVPVQATVDDMMTFLRDLQVIIAATWRDHQKQPSFVITDLMPAEAKKKTGTAA